MSDCCCSTTNNANTNTNAAAPDVADAPQMPANAVNLLDVNPAAR